MSKPDRTESNALSRKQIEAIPCLIGARSLEEGRKKAKLSKATLYAWLKQPAFTARLEEDRQTVISEALATLRTAVTAAVEKLQDLIDAEAENVQLRAAQAVLDFFFRDREINEIERRLEAVERAVANRR